MKEMFKNLMPDFSHLDELLNQHKTSLDELSAEFRIKPGDKSITRINNGLVVIPKQKGVAHIFADLQGCGIDEEQAEQGFIKDLIEGKNPFLIYNGDINDALFEKRDGKPIFLPLDHPNGEFLLENRLAYVDREGKRLVKFAYPENSLAINARIIRLRNLFGDRVEAAFGNHEWPIVNPNFEVFKSGVNLTDNIISRLSKEELSQLRLKYKEFPRLIVLENGYAISHTGPAPQLKKAEDLAEIVYDAGKDDDRKLEFIEKTAIGRLTWGKLADRKARDMDDFFREFLEGEYDEYHANVRSITGVEIMKSLHGHSGIDPILVEKDGEKIPHVGINGFQDFGKFAILATTEGDGCEKARSGELRNGRNDYGMYMKINLNDDYGKIYLGRLGEEAKPRYFSVKGKNTVMKIEEIVSEEKQGEQDSCAGNTGDDDMMNIFADMADTSNNVPEENKKEIPEQPEPHAQIPKISEENKAEKNIDRLSLYEQNKHYINHAIEKKALSLAICNNLSANLDYMNLKQRKGLLYRLMKIQNNQNVVGILSEKAQAKLLGKYSKYALGRIR